MISVEEAQARVLALASRTGTETLPLRHAAGRVLAQDVTAGRDQPPFAASAMDGYAVRAADARPGAVLQVRGEAGAGHAHAGPAVEAGTACRIFTGAPLPAGADRVVIQEDVTRAGDTITLRDGLDGATHVRAAGADFRAGARVAAPRLIAPRDLALMAAMGAAEVTVHRRPVVAIIATGDELVPPGAPARADQIYSSNGPALAALAESAGAEARLLPIARDTEASLRQAFALAEGADTIVTIGGASVGDHDLVAPVAAALGMQTAFYKIAMRPGKPLMAGRLGPAAMLGLPGNPVSALVCALLFLLPLIRAQSGHPAPLPRLQAARLAADLPANGPRAHYMRARLAWGSADADTGTGTGVDTGTDMGGLPWISPFASQDSALLGLLSQADALLIRPAGEGALARGARVACLPL